MIDRFGPRVIAVPAAVLKGIGRLFAANAHTLAAVVLAGAFLGSAWRRSYRCRFEYSGTETRGAATGAYNLAFCGGASCGALLGTAATLAGGGYTFAIVACALAPVAVLPYVLQSKDATGSRAARATFERGAV